MIDVIPKVGMGALLLASVPVGGDPGLWAQWGLAGVVVGYTLWRDHGRERRMSEAIERDHTWVRETLVGALERNTSALEKMTTRLDERERAS
ncbi:MAG: hypothetical protein AB7F75_00795 [Planctomycetota bacterium]